MKKNGQYVGVDEKYIPEDEKYVDNETNGEIKDTINDGMKSVNKFVSNKENQKKGWKIVKGVGIGYLVVVGIIVLIIVIGFVFGFIMMFKATNVIKDTTNTIKDTMDDQINDMNNNDNELENMFNETEKQMFNANFETYSGTKNSTLVKLLLEKIVTNNKNNNEHIITVVYNARTSTAETIIMSIKHSLEDGKDYEISLDYDSNGFVNKVIINDL